MTLRQNSSGLPAASLLDKIAVPVLFHGLPDFVRRKRHSFGPEVLPLGGVDEQLRGDSVGSSRWIQPQPESVRDYENVLVGLNSGRDRPFHFFRIGDVDVVVENENMLDPA